MINLILRKFKKIDCKICKGAYYPLAEDEGCWEIPNSEKINLFDLDDDYKWDIKETESNL